MKNRLKKIGIILLKILLIFIFLPYYATLLLPLLCYIITGFFNPATFYLMKNKVPYEIKFNSMERTYYAVWFDVFYSDEYVSEEQIQLTFGF